MTKTIQEQDKAPRNWRYKFTCTCGYKSYHPTLIEAVKQAEEHEC